MSNFSFKKLLNMKIALVLLVVLVAVAFVAAEEEEKKEGKGKGKRGEKMLERMCGEKKEGEGEGKGKGKWEKMSEECKKIWSDAKPEMCKKFNAGDKDGAKADMKKAFEAAKEKECMPKGRGKGKGKGKGKDKEAEE